MKQKSKIFLILLIIVFQDQLLSHIHDTGQHIFSNNDTNNIFYAQNNELETIIVDLNGTWNFTPEGLSETTIQVPCFYVWKEEYTRYTFPGKGMNGPWKVIEGYPEVVYERNLDIPSSMSGKHIFLHFESVNYLADVYVNSQYVGSHVGGLLPFELDITSYVNVPSSNTLEVHIRYWDNRFVEMNGTKNPRWPVGYWRNYWYLGIVDDVYLIARSPVYVEDSYIRTSVRQYKLNATITVNNADTVAHTVDVKCEIESPYILIGMQQVQIDSGASVEVTFEKDWSDPILWFPENPHLYNFETSVYENQSRIHGDQLRIGFREFWIEGDHYVLNGIRRNLMGDNIVLHFAPRYWILSQNEPDLWIGIVDSLLSLNFNVIRFHEMPPPQWMIDVCDEKGMMVIAESHIYPTWNLDFVNSSPVVTNYCIWQKEWVKANRNHPSIVVWSAENEMYINIGNSTWSFNLQDYILFGNAVEEMDQTRPIIFEGDGDLEGNKATYSYHYIYGYPTGCPSDIYDLSNYVKSSKPTIHGELDWKRSDFPGSERIMRQMVKVRVMREVGFDDMRPYRLDWAWHPDTTFSQEAYYGWEASAEEIQFLRNSMNPVAVFDKRYYRYSVVPTTPVYNEGDPVNRNLVLFNNEIEEELVECLWNVILNDSIVDQGGFTRSVPFGTHVIQAIQFPAPCVTQDQYFELELQTRKNGQQRFSEKYLFQTQDIGISPPDRVTNLRGNRNANSLLLNWSPVEKDIEDHPTTIDHYQVYRSTDFFFNISHTDTFDSVQDTTFIDSQTGVLGNSTNNYLYRTSAVDNHGLRSELSDRIGEFDFDLQTTTGTDFNEIALPLTISGINNAEELMAAIPGCNSIARWNAASQGYEQYVPVIPSTNFDVEMGYPYYVNATSNTVFTLIGLVAYPTFNLITTTGTDFNEIMIPLHKTELLKASDLMADIPNCNSVAKWNTSSQGYEQYVPVLPITDFDVRTGYPYYVNITANTSWPSSGMPKSVSDSEAEFVESDIEISHAPHVVWGRYMFAGEGLVDGHMHFTAYIVSRPSEKLTDASPGCVLSNNIWIVQCGNFSSGWKAGEELKIVFEDTNHKYYDETEVVLSYDPEDQAGSIEFMKGVSVPDCYKLHQNIPNPFNSQTTIRYQITEASRVTMRIYNLMGQEIEVLIDRRMEAGFHEVKWNGKDRNNHPLPSNIYIIEMQAGVYKESLKMVLIR